MNGRRGRASAKEVEFICTPGLRQAREVKWQAGSTLRSTGGGLSLSYHQSGTVFLMMCAFRRSQGQRARHVPPTRPPHDPALLCCTRPRATPKDHGTGAPPSALGPGTRLGSEGRRNSFEHFFVEEKLLNKHFSSSEQRAANTARWACTDCREALFSCL
jgi:hypothetical protein